VSLATISLTVATVPGYHVVDRCPVEICTLLGYKAASSCNPLPMCQDNVSGPSSRVKKSKKSRKPARETRGLCRERHGQGQLNESRTANAEFLYHFKIFMVVSEFFK
jgi:hypothetical protein